jgi:peptidoglycan/LPS O-acetylase OafA/YrhL
MGFLDRLTGFLIGALDRFGSSMTGRKALSLLGLGGVIFIALGLSGTHGAWMMRAMVLAMLVVFVILVRAIIVKLRDPQARAQMDAGLGFLRRKKD